MANPEKKIRWDETCIPDLHGKVIIVTGGNTGIGLQASLAFAGNGAETILACRNETKALRAVSHIKNRIPQARVSFIQLDLGSLKSIHRFAEQFNTNYTRLDILLNNAGVILNRCRTTADGLESHMGINHLGHFALTGLMMDRISKTGGTRVINVSSTVYRSGRMDFDNIRCTSAKGYSRFGAYARSKLANLLFTHELNQRFKGRNMDALSVAAHPGYAYTDFGRATFFKVLKYLFYPLVITVTQNAARGALPSLRAAVDPDVQGGEFFGPGGRGERKGYPVKIQSNGASRNDEDARLLWEISEQLTGIKYL